MQKPRSKSKHRVVVVEDDRTSRKIISRILEEAGYDVLECAHAKDALHISEMNPPRAMIVDVMLPDMKGTRIVQELSYNHECRFIKYIFLTGILSKKSHKPNYFFQIEGKRYRALGKPIRKGQLLRHLARAIELSLEQEKAEKNKKEEFDPFGYQPVEGQPACPKDSGTENEVILTSEVS